MKNVFRTFLRNDNGAITTEFMVLAAAAVGLCIAAYANIEDGTKPIVNVDADAALEKFVSGF